MVINTQNQRIMPVKNNQSIMPHILKLVAPALCFLLMIGCKKEDAPATNLAPQISGVTTLENRTNLLSAVNYGDWIMIKGRNLATTFKVDFNGILAADTLYYADDTSITVKIPPVLNDPLNNPITVTTKYGTATYNFKIMQPAPELLSFSPMAGPAGTRVTILGNYFRGVTSVKFDNIDATIVSSTKDQIVVTVPAGVTAAYIFVTTPIGTVKSAITYGFKFMIYEDALTATWNNTSYSATAVYNNTTNVQRGANSIKVNYTANFGALRITKATPAFSTTGYTALKFSVFVPAASVGKKVKVTLNGQSATGLTLTFAKSGWNDFQIPFTNLGNYATITSITFQEFSAMLQELYFDDIGLI
jgi:hypothetical protein